MVMAGVLPGHVHVWITSSTSPAALIRQAALVIPRRCR
jgi:hypothetical protein